MAAYCDSPAASVAAALDFPLPAAAEQTELFSFQLYPYASVYTGAEGMLGGEARDRVAGFWRACGVTPPAEPDHLAALLGLYSAFSETSGERARHLRHALLWEHLLSWLPAWLARVDEIAPEPYRAWASLLRDVLLAETEELGPAATLPLHLRLAPPAGGPLAILTAVSSGVILTRSDLARCARELRLGLRQGERRYVLEALVAQDGPAVMYWLADEAFRQAEGQRSFPRVWQPVTEHWTSRAEAIAAELRKAADRVAATP